MNKLMDAAIRLLHKQEDLANKRLYAVLVEGRDPYDIPDPSFDKIWFWGLKRWQEKWPHREYELRQQLKRK